MENRNSTRTIAWLLVLIFLPGLGIFLYFYLGQNHRKKKTFIKKRKEDYKVLKRLLDTQINFTKKGSFFKENYNDLRSKLVPLLLNNGDAPITFNNDIKILNNGKITFDTMLKDIREAKSHIHIEYFIIKDSEIGEKFKKALIEKAKEGVKVRFIYDAVGCWKLSKKFKTDLIEAGVELKSFLPVILPFFQSRLNYRNHRKILVVDGKIGFTGGLNIGDEYLGKSPERGFWRDTHVKVEGEAVYILQSIFLKDWHFVSGEDIDGYKFFPKQNINGNKAVQIVSGGPDTYWESIHQGYFTAISGAVKNVYIVSPYLVPDESILMALKTSALRGLDVRLLLPGKPDHKTVFWASKSHFEELLEAGVRIFQYQKGFVHSKLFIVDDNIASVGTTNLDIRSLQLNFEVNAFIYDTGVSANLKKYFLEDLEDSKEVILSEYRKRGYGHKVKESIARLLSPIL